MASIDSSLKKENKEIMEKREDLKDVMHKQGLTLCTLSYEDGEACLNKGYIAFTNPTKNKDVFIEAMHVQKETPSLRKQLLNTALDILKTENWNRTKQNNRLGNACLKLVDHVTTQESPTHMLLGFQNVSIVSSAKLYEYNF